MPRYWVIIPAAGVGARMSQTIPKQYLPLKGRSVLWHSVSLFLQQSDVAGVVVVVSASDAMVEPALGDLLDSSGLHLVRRGGDTRQQTVLNGLEWLDQSGLTAAVGVGSGDWVLVHDAARPGLTSIALQRLIGQVEQAAASGMAGGLLALPVADTLKRANRFQVVQSTESRDGVWQAQTPQMFGFQALLQALRKARETGLDVTDEASAIEAQGGAVLIVPGEKRNLKITVAQDLAWLEAAWDL